ncbi:MAG TPA: FAD binding domain-containing protein [Terriglobales bacterium]
MLRPRTVQEAVELLAKHSDRVAAWLRPAGTGQAPSPHKLTILAGGTDLIPSMRQKLFEPEYVLDVRNLTELRGVWLTSEGMAIGALTTLTAIERSPLLRRHYPVLSQAASTVASPVLRNMGTIGGNICLDTRCLWYNQSLTWRKGCGFCIKKDGDLCHVAPGGRKCWAAFSGDTPPALLCLDAEIEIASLSGVRRMPLRDFYTGEGDSYRRLQATELLTRIILPMSTGDYDGAYRKLRVRGSIDYPLAGVAFAFKRANGHLADARLAITAVNPAPVLVKGVSQLLAGKLVDEALAEELANLAAKTAKPLTTSALTPEYRREMIRVFTKRAVLAVLQN